MVTEGAQFMNKRLEQNQRGPSSRIDVMKGFKNIFKAQIFCTVFDEIRQFFRMKNKMSLRLCVKQPVLIGPKRKRNSRSKSTSFKALLTKEKYEEFLKRRDDWKLLVGNVTEIF